jgi:sugar O-acyltransferase (sialic acid O-acetyltransferase NeuD family)
MARIVIFGTRDNASLAHFYLRHDSPHEVVAFTTNEVYLPPELTFEGLPVVAFEELHEHYPPDSVMAFAPVSATQMNGARRLIFAAFKDRGYECISYVSSKSTVWPGQRIGENCFIFEDNTIQPYTEIGDNVILWSGNHLGHHSTIGDSVFFTSHVVLSGHCTVESRCFIGVNATIRNGARLAEGTLIGQAANVVEDTDPWGVYVGNPAKKIQDDSRAAVL